MKISQYLDLPRKMRDARKKAGLSQKYIAEKLDITQQSYARYENGVAEPSIEGLEIFCKEVHTTIPKLLGIIDPVTEREYIVNFSEWIYTLKQLEEQIEDYVTRILDVAILTTLRLEERSRKNESNDKVNMKTNEKTGKTTKEELKQILRNLQDGEILEIDFSNEIPDNNPSEDNQNGE